MSKAFSLFLMVALVLGGSLGGAFVGGVALGKSQGETSADALRAGRLSDGPGLQYSGEFGPRSGPGGADRQGRQGPGSGGVDRQGFRDGLQGLSGRGSDGRGFGGRRGVSGVIGEVADNQVTITTPQGPVIVTLGQDTSINQVIEGSRKDLIKGTRVRVVGPRDDDGRVQARAITLVPGGFQR